MTRLFDELFHKTWPRLSFIIYMAYFISAKDKTACVLFSLLSAKCLYVQLGEGALQSLSCG